MQTLPKINVEAYKDLDIEYKVLDKGYVKLIDFMGSDASVVRAARQSTTGDLKSYEEDIKLLSYLYRNQHMTPFEMVEVVFELKVPMFIGEQILRHRTFSYNKFSGRYSQMPDEYYEYSSQITKNGKYYLFPMQDQKNKQASGEIFTKIHQDWIEGYCGDDGCGELGWDSLQKESFESYKILVDGKVSKEVARLNLPLSTYTKMWMKGNLRNFMHFLELRMDSHAQWEIQQYANKMHEIISKIAPESMKLFDRYKYKLVDTHATT